MFNIKLRQFSQQLDKSFQRFIRHDNIITLARKWRLFSQTFVTRSICNPLFRDKDEDVFTIENISIHFSIVYTAKRYHNTTHKLIDIRDFSFDHLCNVYENSSITTLAWEILKGQCSLTISIGGNDFIAKMYTSRWQNRVFRWQVSKDRANKVYRTLLINALIKLR